MTLPFNNEFLFRPIKYISLLFIAGLFLGKRLDVSPITAQYFLIGIAFISLLFFFFQKRLFTYSVIALFFPIGLILFKGYANLESNEGSLRPYADGNRRVIEGVVLSRDEARDKTRFAVEGEKVYEASIPREIDGRIMLTVASGAKAVVPGDRIRFSGRLKIPRNFGNPGGFDYEGFLKSRGIYATSFLKDDRPLAIMGKGKPFWQHLYRFRARVKEAIGESGPSDAKGVLMALTLGNKGEMRKETVQAFRKSGAAHVLAISGLHMGIVAFFFFRIFKWLLSRSERILFHNMVGKGAALITLFPLTVYLFTSGMATSAVRAYIMVAVFLFSVILEREGEIYNTIALAAFIILMIWPYALFEASFQLSFSAVIAIVYMAPKMESILFKSSEEKRRGLTRKLTLFILVSLAASLGTAPIISYHFMEVSMIGIFSNLLIIPILGFLVVPLSSLALFSSAISLPIAKALFLCLSYLTEISISIVELMASLPFSSVMTKPSGPYETVLYYILLWSLFNVRKRWAASTAVIIPIFFLTSVAAFSIQENSSSDLKVTFLSVGQGESTFIRFPKGKTMLIDGGGFYNNSFDTGAMVVRPYLLSRGIKKIDYLVMSHPHPDHMNGLIHILTKFGIGEVWTTDEPADYDNHRRFKDIIREKEIRALKILDDSPDIIIEGVKVEFLHPPHIFWYGDGDNSLVNNRSLVMRIKYGDLSFLLPGDLELEGEKRLLKLGYDISADVIKIPHHGSLTSSSADFIYAVSPEYAVFTVGYMNRFSFPKEDVVRRYEDADAVILRTDIDGAITFISDGKTMVVKRFREEDS